MNCVNVNALVQVKPKWVRVFCPLESERHGKEQGRLLSCLGPDVGKKDCDFSKDS